MTKKSKKIKIKCLGCRKYFYVKPCYKNRKYCSKACHMKHNNPFKGHNFGLCKKCGKYHNYGSGMKGHKHTKEWKEKLSKRNSKENNPFFGKHHTEETKEKIRKINIEWFKTHENPFKGHNWGWCKKCGKYHGEHPRGMKGKTHTLEYKEHLSKLWKSGYFDNVVKDPVRRKKISTSLKKIWNEMSPSIKKRKVINSLRSVRRRPSSLEKKMMRILKENNLPFKYIGDGRRYYGYPPINPDFVDINHQGKCIEVGCKRQKEVWSYKSWKTYVKERTKKLKNVGFDVLYIWDEDLKNENKVVEMVKSFVEK